MDRGSRSTRRELLRDIGLTGAATALAGSGPVSAAEAQPDAAAMTPLQGLTEGGPAPGMAARPPLVVQAPGAIGR